MPSTNYWTRWDESNKKWQYSTDGTNFYDLVENPTHEKVYFNTASSPGGAANQGRLYFDSSALRLRLSENNGNFIDVNQNITKAGVYVDTNGISTAPGIMYVWRAPFACTIISAYAHRQGGTGATVNAQNGGLDIRSTDLSLTTTSWTDFGSLQNTSVSAGNSISFEIATVTGSPTQIGFTIEFRRTAQ